MKRLALALVIALFTVACASTTADSPTTTVAARPGDTPPTTASSTAPPASDTSATSPAPPDTPSDSPDDVQKPPPEGPEAPDFTEVLASGETYTLSEAVKPVYLIFWAEW